MNHEHVEMLAKALYDQSNLSERPDFNREPPAIKESFRKGARACLASIESAGMVIVPREPTGEMVDAGADADMPGGRWGEPTFRESTIDATDARAVWSAMLAAAPKQGCRPCREVDAGG